MDLKIKKELTSNWFKTLQNSFCNSISKFEKNKIKFKSTTWKRNLKKDEARVSHCNRPLTNKIATRVGLNL